MLVSLHHNHKTEDYEVFRSYLLAFFAVIGSILESIAQFWRGQKLQQQNIIQNSTALISNILTTLAPQLLFNNWRLKEGY